MGGCSSPTGTEVVRCTLVPPEVEGEDVEGEGLGGREGGGGRAGGGSAYLLGMHCR